MGLVSRILSILLLAVSAWADEPYVPANDDEVLEVLPRSLLVSRDELNGLRQQLIESPENSMLAAQIAGRYLQIGSASGDPRFYGYARAAIQPWWDSPKAPPAILKRRAKLKEKDHQYDAALADLERLLNHRPRDVQAWIERANIYRVQGKYAEAQQACESLREFAGDIPNIVCSVPLKAVTGAAEEAYASLEQTAPEIESKTPGVMQWVFTVQAEVAEALGRNEQAEQHYQDGLRNDPENIHLKRSFADFLLDRERPDQALELLREYTNDNGVLLRAAIAARRTGDDTLAAQWRRELERRFDEIRLRGGQPHGRFESRFALEVHDDPEGSLVTALANWQKQKEVRDTRNVLEAAVAAGDFEAAKPVIDFLKRHGTEHVVLRKLVQQLDVSR